MVFDPPGTDPPQPPSPRDVCGWSPRDDSIELGYPTPQGSIGVSAEQSSEHLVRRFRIGSDRTSSRRTAGPLRRVISEKLPRQRRGAQRGAIRAAETEEVFCEISL